MYRETITFRGLAAAPITEVNELIRKSIYNSIDQKRARKIHNEGFSIETPSGVKINLKPFCFSRLQGFFYIRGRSIIYPKVSKLTISSIDDQVIKDFNKHIVNNGFQFGNRKLKVVRVSLETYKRTNNIELISPLVLKINQKEGDQKTRFVGPYDEEFNRLLNDNIRKKYLYMHGEIPDDLGEISLEPSMDQEAIKEIVKFKDMYLTTYRGKFRLRGDGRLVKTAYYLGLGQRNSQGFGMFRFVS
jgi:CRISPR-associated endoribonuclease Cas6